MTILSVVQEAAVRLGLAVPSVLYSGTTDELVELQKFVNEVAKDIASGHDWQELKGIATITGDGSTTAWSLPTDYDRQIKDAKLHSSAWATPLKHQMSADEWLHDEVQSFDTVVNRWIIYGGQIHVKPALASAATAKYFYVSNKIVDDNGGTPKTDFDADTDTFRLDERLLKLGLIWYWKAAKGQAYAEDMATFEAYKQRLISNDAGSKKITVGRVRMPDDAEYAYPTSVTVS